MAGNRPRLTQEISGSGIPEVHGDKYRPGDYIVDKLYFQGSIGDVYEMISNPPCIISGMVVTQGTGSSINISAGYALVKVTENNSVTLHDFNGAAIGTPLSTGDRFILLNYPGGTNIPVSATTDGTTVHYVKLQIAEAGELQRMKAAQPSVTYDFIVLEEADITIDTVAPTSDDFRLDSFTAVAGPTFTFAGTSREPSAVTNVFGDTLVLTADVLTLEASTGNAYLDLSGLSTDRTYTFPNRDFKFGTIPDWAMGVDYDTDDVVVNGGIIFRCLTDTPDTGTFDPGDWESISGVDDIIPGGGTEGQTLVHDGAAFVPDSVDHVKLSGTAGEDITVSDYPIAIGRGPDGRLYQYSEDGVVEAQAKALAFTASVAINTALSVQRMTDTKFVVAWVDTADDVKAILIEWTGSGYNVGAELAVDSGVDADPFPPRMVRQSDTEVMIMWTTLSNSRPKAAMLTEGMSLALTASTPTELFTSNIAASIIDMLRVASNKFVAIISGSGASVEHICWTYSAGTITPGTRLTGSDIVGLGNQMGAVVVATDTYLFTLRKYTISGTTISEGSLASAPENGKIVNDRDDVNSYIHYGYFGATLYARYHDSSNFARAYTVDPSGSVPVYTPVSPTDYDAPLKPYKLSNHADSTYSFYVAQSPFYNPNLAIYDATTYEFIAPLPLNITGTGTSTVSPLTNQAPAALSSDKLVVVDRVSTTAVHIGIWKVCLARVFEGFLTSSVVEDDPVSAIRSGRMRFPNSISDIRLSYIQTLTGLTKNRMDQGFPSEFTVVDSNTIDTGSHRTKQALFDNRLIAVAFSTSTLTESEPFDPGYYNITWNAVPTTPRALVSIDGYRYELINGTPDAQEELAVRVRAFTRFSLWGARASGGMSFDLLKM